ncbi:DUF4345 domain-containing protein [Hyphomonas sp.]|uniref:DUF4345 domain-containing protein n=1 Tax=Hyphomonas sp. TaxID=87 RepID=UPI0035271B36
MKRGLQIALGVFSLIPVAFALLGFLAGAGRLSPEGVTVDLDNQYRYFSGMYLVVSFMIWSIIPAIEKHGHTMLLVSAAIFIGGLGRVVSYMTLGAPSQDLVVGMGIELVVPVIFVLWQRAVAAKA